MSAEKKAQAAVKPRVIVAFAGRAGCGKSTAAKLAAEILGMGGWNARRVSFVDPLKAFCMDALGLRREQVYGEEKAVLDPFWNETPRAIMQRIGTEAMRNGFRDDVWVRALERRIEQATELDRRMLEAEKLRRIEAHWQGGHESPQCLQRAWVIDDMRFPNEKEAIGRMGGFCFWIERPGLAPGAEAAHVSEQALGPSDAWTSTIVNDGSRADLESTVANTLSHRIAGILGPQHAVEVKRSA